MVRSAAKLLLVSVALLSTPAVASDHLDSPSVIADPRADMGDLFAWMSPDRRELNLVMTVVGKAFSNRVTYAFHIDSGPRFGATVATTKIECRFEAADRLTCRLGEEDVARGDPRGESGITSGRGQMRVFAGLRDDPFFNNVRGSRAAYDVAGADIAKRLSKAPHACPAFTNGTATEILEQWRQTDNGPGKNFLAGWSTAALVVTVQLDRIRSGGPVLAVWGTISDETRQIDRMGRPLTGNALLVTLGSAELRDRSKEAYNAAPPANWPAFAPLIAEGLALYDGFDGACGDQLLADRSREGLGRYARLSELLADDRLWINSRSGICRAFFAVELAALLDASVLRTDCGGRTPVQDAVDIYRSLLVNGTLAGVDDGVDEDDARHSTSRFPFLAAPAEPSS